MDMDKVIGAGRQVVGTVREVVGRLAGDLKGPATGMARQIADRLLAAAATMKNTLHR